MLYRGNLDYCLGSVCGGYLYRAAGCGSMVNICMYSWLNGTIYIWGRSGECMVKNGHGSAPWWIQGSSLIRSVMAHW